MNLVGKIFVVLIFVLSLVLMSLTLTVYVTHTNWRLVADNNDTSQGIPMGYKQQLEAANAENEELRVQNDELKEQIDTEMENRRKALAGLETTLAAQKEELVKLQEEIDKSRESIRTSIANVKASQDRANQLTEENTNIRDQVAKLVLERDKEVKKNVEMTDKLNEVQREIGDLQKRSESLASELAAAKQVMSYLNIKPDVQYYASMSAPSGLMGRVLAVNTDRKMVEISVGSDDGVREGHQFDVQTADGSGYVGRINVVEVQPDRAVCNNVPGYDNGVYAPGNRVLPVKAGTGTGRK